MNLDEIIEELTDEILQVQKELNKLDSKLKSLKNSLNVAKEVKYGGNVSE